MHYAQARALPECWVGFENAMLRLISMPIQIPLVSAPANCVTPAGGDTQAVVFVSNS